MVAVRLVALVSIVLAGCIGFDSGPEDDPEPDAGAVDDDGGSGGTPTFMEACEVDGTSCEEPYFCFVYNMRGPHCTNECTLDSDCEAPSRGCNMMGVCKTP
jgi:hypothetical protein